MPIIVKDFTWSQTRQALQIKVPVNPVKHEKVDIFTTDSYIKASYNPFLFELFPLYDVDNEKSKCIVKEDVILMDLIKKEEREWECLEKDLSKAEKVKLKQEILDKCIEKAKQDAEDKRIKKSQMDRFTVQRAMEIDGKQHDLMDARRNAQTKLAMDSLEEWRLKNDDTNYGNKELGVIRSNKINDKNYKLTKISNKPNSGVKIIELPPSDDEKDTEENQVNKTVTKNPKVKPSKPAPQTPLKSEYVEKKRKEVATRVLPKMREAAELEITHTKRTFPTPSRESTAQEEEDWIKNITLARRATGFVSEDLRPEEQDPQWCKEKGDEFFRSGNFLGAISAYTHGLLLSDKLPSLFANRAATHFALGNFNKCVTDCSSALDLMVPPCEGNRKSRAKCIARRAAALARLGYLSKAIDEMKAASKLLPEDENIKKDVYDMERAWEQNPDSD